MLYSIWFDWKCAMEHWRYSEWMGRAQRSWAVSDKKAAMSEGNFVLNETSCRSQVYKLVKDLRRIRKVQGDIEPRNIDRVPGGGASGFFLIGFSESIKRLICKESKVWLYDHYHSLGCLQCKIRSAANSGWVLLKPPLQPYIRCFPNCENCESARSLFKIDYA